jgi:hypothetical protein
MNSDTTRLDDPKLARDGPRFGECEKVPQPSMKAKQ